MTNADTTTINTQATRLSARRVHDEMAPRLEAIEDALNRGAVARSWFGDAMTVTFGMFIPIVSYTLSKAAGKAYMHDYTWVSYGLLVLIVATLAVSLTHVAEAVEHITGSTKFISFATAIALDATLVAMEALHATAAAQLHIETLTGGLALAICAVSAAANIYAFRLAQTRRNDLTGAMR